MVNYLKAVHRAIKIGKNILVSKIPCEETKNNFVGSALFN